jgi:hypothetical protein
VGLFVTCPGRNSGSKPNMCLLAFAPLLDETNFTATNHATFIYNTLEWYNLSVEHLVCLIGDNCATNKALAGDMGRPLIGCRSHRFNLAIEAYIKQHLGTEQEMVGKLMGKLSTLKQAGRLRLQTALRPVKRNDTRWLGTVNMFNRYQRLKTHIDQTDTELAELTPNASSEIKIKSHLKNLEAFKSVTLSLQKEEVTLLQSHFLFQSVIAEFTNFTFEDYIGENAAIVHAPIFEDALIKIQDGRESDLTAAEVESVSRLQKASNSNASQGQQPSVSGLSFAEAALKRQKLATESQRTYVDTSFIMPTSNEVERLFSLASRIFTPSRRNMQPITLEALVFLNRNRALWDMKLVAEIVHQKDLVTEVIDLEDEDDSDEEVVASMFF